MAFAASLWTELLSAKISVVLERYELLLFHVQLLVLVPKISEVSGSSEKVFTKRAGSEMVSAREDAVSFHPQPSKLTTPLEIASLLGRGTSSMVVLFR